MTSALDPAEILARAERIRAAGGSQPRAGRDPINQPMINNWVEAIGDTNPIYVSDDAACAAGHDGIVAPPAMIQVWTMAGLHGQRTADDPPRSGIVAVPRRSGGIGRRASLRG